MRKVFTSIRLETVEGVAKLLRDEGIEVRITHGRSYKGNRRSDFSYRQPARPEPQPALWIIRSEDQPRARALLRQAGLMESTRTPGAAALPDPAGDNAPGLTPQQRARRLRTALLVILVVVTLVTVIRLF